MQDGDFAKASGFGVVSLLKWSPLFLKEVWFQEVWLADNGLKIAPWYAGGIILLTV